MKTKGNGMTMITLEKGVTVTLLERQDYGIMLVEVKGDNNQPDKEYIFQSTAEADTFGKCWELDANNTVKSKTVKEGIYSLEQELKERGSHIKDPGYDFKEDQPMLCLGTQDATYWLGYVDTKDPEAIGIEVSNYQTGDIITTTINKEGQLNYHYDCLEPITKPIKPKANVVSKTKQYQKKKRSF